MNIFREETASALMCLMLDYKKQDPRAASRRALDGLAKLPRDRPVSREDFLYCVYLQNDVLGQPLDPRRQNPPSRVRRTAALAIDLMFYAFVPYILLDSMETPLYHPEVLTWLPQWIQEDFHMFAGLVCFQLREVISSRSLGKYFTGLEIIQLERVDSLGKPSYYQTTEIPATRSMA